MKPSLKRREFLSRFGAALAGVGMLVGLPLFRKFAPSQEVEWYEVVQDAQDPDQWHLNRFSAPSLGDLAAATHHGHEIVEAADAALVMTQLQGVPLRIQYRDGRKEQTFPT